MLLDDEEFRIMACAAQWQLRVQDPDTRFRSIFERYFTARHFEGQKIIELGPGQHDFARLATAAGATVVTMDHDPAVVALGRKRGHESILADFMTYDWNSLAGRFDGLFLCNSITAQWYSEPAPLQNLVENVCSVLKSGGWGWAAPWNRFRDKTPEQSELFLRAQQQAFQLHGFKKQELAPPAVQEDGAYDHWELYLRGFDHRLI